MSIFNPYRRLLRAWRESRGAPRPIPYSISAVEYQWFVENRPDILQEMRRAGLRRG